MSVRETINKILNNDSLDEDRSDGSKCESIEELITQFGWVPVERELFDILSDHEQGEKNWQTAAEVFWGALLDKRIIADANRLIALVIKRLPPDKDSNENNLAWSIASEIKGLDYLSDFDPLTDPLIAKEISRLEE